MSRSEGTSKFLSGNVSIRRKLQISGTYEKGMSRACPKQCQGRPVEPCRSWWAIVSDLGDLEVWFTGATNVAHCRGCCLLLIRLSQMEIIDVRPFFIYKNCSCHFHFISSSTNIKFIFWYLRENSLGNWGRFHREGGFWSLGSRKIGARVRKVDKKITNRGYRRPLGMSLYRR